VLVELAAAPETEGAVRTALDAVQGPDMLPIPLIVGAVLIYLARIKTKEETVTTIDPQTGAMTTRTAVERQNLDYLSHLTENASALLRQIKGLG
jgi:hypothetical protein